LQVVVAYFRAAYTPVDYAVAEEKCWDARLTIERSTAIKCPSIGYHLAGTKKVQQALYDRNTLLRSCGCHRLCSNAASVSSHSFGPTNPKKTCR
jgi:hypothetical protein